MADGYPFTLGVASGSPTATGVVLWTPLAPEPLAADGGMDDEAVAVRWEVADDADARMYARTDWGRLARFHLVDGRQYRTPQACPRPGRGGANSARAASSSTATGRCSARRRSAGWPTACARRRSAGTLSARGRAQSQTDEIRASNPHIHLANSARRGYVVFDVEPAQVRARLRVVGDVRDRATGVKTLATFTVAAGRPGAHKA